MKKRNFENPLILFSCSAIGTSIFYSALSYLHKDSYIYNFFFRCWYIQAVTTGLFIAAILYIILRAYQLNKEREILNIKVSIERFPVITSKEAKKLMDVIPEKYRDAISFRRMSELLRGYLYQEEVVRLNQELSRRDTEQIDGGHLILNALRQLIPVLGFLGTVIGLSLGMAKFPELSESVGSIESMRFMLKDFAASLSVAFDTTLLALGYTVIIVLTSSLLRRTEESFVSEVDSKARMLITKLEYKPDPALKQEDRFEIILERHINSFQRQLAEGLKEPLKDWLNTWQNSLSSNMKEIIEQLSAPNRENLKDIANTLQKNGDAFLQKLDEMKEGLHRPPRYEIIVQPLDGKCDE